MRCTICGIMIRWYNKTGVCRPKYNKGRGNNFDYEISLFIRELIERGIIKNA